MSVERHPNINAAKFTTDIVTSFYESLRSHVDPKKINDERERNLIVQFVEAMEELADEAAKMP